MLLEKAEMAVLEQHLLLQALAQFMLAVVVAQVL
jgi:hypothetical protein